MKSKAKILTSFLLVVLILVSVLFTGMISASAYSTPPNPNRLPEYTPSAGVKTYNINFALPKKWTNEIWEYYGSNCGLYWWGSMDNPDEAPAAAGHGWPGWKMKKSDEAINLYTSLVPKGTANMIFSNFIDGGLDTSYPEYNASMNTKDLTRLDYICEGDSDYFPKEFWDYIYDTYYDDFVANPSYQIAEFGNYAKNFFYSAEDDNICHYINDMVFVVDTVNTVRAQVSPVSGKAGLDGAFYFYYGNGEFGIWPTKEMCIEKEGLKVDDQGNVLIAEETVQEKTDFVVRNHTDAYDGTTEREFVVFGNFTGKYWETPSNGTIGGCIWTLENNTLTISGNGEMGYHSQSDSPWGYDIENVIIGDGVTSISDDSFFGCSRLTSVTISDSVTSIGDNAFFNCSSLESITIPDSVTSIGDNAFFNCSSLESITIPDSVTSIGDNVFSNCSNDLEIICVRGSRAESYAYSYNIKVKVPDFLYDKLDDGTLKISKYLGNQTNVIIPDNILGKQVSSIKAWIFANDTDIESVVIPDTVTTIPKGAFYNCVELKTVTMGKNVTEIGANAFEKCLYLENINLSDNLQTIGDEAFYDCRRLKTLDIPATVTSIGEEAFTNCRSLQSLTIPKGVNKLGDESSLGYGMFENCKSLTEIKIPSSVEFIQSNAFDGCSNVTVLGARNSYAESYAAENNIAFRAVVDDAPIGDSNGDGNVDVLDAAAIQKFASGMADMTSDQQYFADVNNDGVVDILDAAEIQKFAAGIITEFKKKG